jgi:hypothetical protein
VTKQIINISAKKKVKREPQSPGLLPQAEPESACLPKLGDLSRGDLRQSKDNSDKRGYFTERTVGNNKKLKNLPPNYVSIEAKQIIPDFKSSHNKGSIIMIPNMIHSPSLKSSKMRRREEDDVPLVEIKLSAVQNKKGQNIIDHNKIPESTFCLKDEEGCFSPSEALTGRSYQEQSLRILIQDIEGEDLRGEHKKMRSELERSDILCE